MKLVNKHIELRGIVMSRNLDKDYKEAKAHVSEIKEFYTNLLTYCIVIPFLAGINFLTSPGYHWFYWPMLGWGIGVAFHGLNVFVLNNKSGSAWEERKIREYMGEEDYKKIKDQKDNDL